MPAAMLRVLPSLARWSQEAPLNHGLLLCQLPMVTVPVSWAVVWLPWEAVQEPPALCPLWRAGKGTRQLPHT